MRHFPVDPDSGIQQESFAMLVWMPISSLPILAPEVGGDHQYRRHHAEYFRHPANGGTGVIEFHEIIDNHAPLNGCDHGNSKGHPET